MITLFFWSIWSNTSLQWPVTISFLDGNEGDISCKYIAVPESILIYFEVRQDVVKEINK